MQIIRRWVQKLVSVGNNFLIMEHLLTKLSEDISRIFLFTGDQFLHLTVVEM